MIEIVCRKRGVSLPRLEGLQLRIILIIVPLMGPKSFSLITSLAIGLLFTLICAAPSARADETPPQLKFVDGHFEPAAFNIAAGKPVKLTVINRGTSAIEFESFELNRERVVHPGQTISVQLPKLDPGQYHFFDDFHHEVAQGTITAQ